MQLLTSCRGQYLASRSWRRELGQCQFRRSPQDSTPVACRPTTTLEHINYTTVAACRSGNDVRHINEVNSTSGPVSTGMGDCLRTGKPPRYATSHHGQLSLLLYAGREMISHQRAVMLCGWRVKAGWLIPYMDKFAVIIKSGQSNLTKSPHRRRSAAPGLFNRIRQVATMCTRM